MSNLPSLPTAVLGLQAVANTVFGLYGVVRPAEIMAKLTSDFGGVLPDAVAHALGLQLISMGILTAFAARRPELHRPALIARVVLHLAAGLLFWNAAKTKNVPLTEIGTAGLNAIAIAFC